jgi:hypothetical protein
MKSIEKFKEQNGIKDNGLKEFFELTLTSYDFKEEVPFDDIGEQYYDLINENPEARMLDEKDILVLLKADAKQVEGFLEFKDPNTEKVLSIPVNDTLNKRVFKYWVADDDGFKIARIVVVDDKLRARISEIRDNDKAVCVFVIGDDSVIQDFEDFEDLPS